LGRRSDGKKPAERGHIAQRAVDLGIVHASEIGRDFFQSIYLNTVVELLVEYDRHGFD